MEDSSDEDIPLPLSSPVCLDNNVHQNPLFLPKDIHPTCPVNRPTLVSNGCPVSSSTPQMSQEEMDGFNGLSHRHGSATVEFYRTRSFDPNLFSVREVSPDKIAEQLTLIDLALLKSIRREEFNDCCWTKKEKQTTSPNVVAFSERFNHTSFLVVRDILNERNVKLRAEIVVQFIRVARRLHELNNLHSLVAVILAIDSPPIARLQMTWKNVTRRDRQCFDKLVVFISENENYTALREHLQSLSTSSPCIPYLGLHQRDLVYLDSLRKGRSSEEEQAKYQMEIDKIIDFIQHCQNARYDDLMPHKGIQKYLNSVLFINEFQKFFEDDNYKLSLQIEPPTRKSLRIDSSSRPPPYPHRHHPLRNTKSTEDLLTPLKPEYTGPAYINAMATPPPRPLSNRFSESDIRADKKDLSPPPFVLNVEASSNEALHSGKVKTLPANLQAPKDWKLEMRKVLDEVSEGGHARNNKSSSPSIGVAKRRIGGHSKSQSLGNNVLAVLGIKQSSRAGSPELPHNVSLLDDSLLEHAPGGGVATCVSGQLEYYTPAVSVASSSSTDALSLDQSDDILRDNDEEDALSVAPSETDVIFDGILKRKVLKKAGKVYQFKPNHKFWVQLTPACIVLLPPKYRNSKKAVNGSNLKYIRLFGSRVRHGDPLLKLKETQFILMDSKGNETKFTAENVQITDCWVQEIRQAIINEEDRLRRQEEEKPLIKF